MTTINTEHITSRAEASPSDAAEFVSFFTEGFATNGYDEFAGHFLPRIHPDVILNQPFARTARGHAGFRRIFETLHAAVPDLRIAVRSWGATQDGVLVEFDAIGTLGRREIAIPMTDRFFLDNGIVRRRDSYSNPLTALPTVLPWALAHPIHATRIMSRLLRSERA
jgi:hypothetical protein